MTMQENEAATAVRDEVEAIVAEAQDVRNRVSHLVAGASERLHLNDQGLIGIARSVMDGAAAAVDKAVPHSRDNVLRQVIDGLGDGLSTSAMAAKLAFQEAEAQGKTYASEDLAKFRQDLCALRELFVDMVYQAARKFKSVTVDQLNAQRKHAELTMKRIQPSFESALSAAQKHPLQFCKEAVGAGPALSREALGSLFSGVGRFLDEAGKRLSSKKPT